MYTIIYGLDGLFHCDCMIQDGHERWTEKSLEEAIKSMKVAADVLNHSKIKKKDITILKEVQKQVVDKDLKLFWYGKTRVEARRKLGHINTVAESEEQLLENVEDMKLWEEKLW